MFQSLMTIIRKIYLYLTKVIFVKILGKITSLYKFGDVAACGLCAVQSERVCGGIRDVSVT